MPGRSDCWSDGERRELAARVGRIAALHGGPDDMQREVLVLLTRRLALTG